MKNYTPIVITPYYLAKFNTLTISLVSPDYVIKIAPTYDCGRS